MCAVEDPIAAAWKSKWGLYFPNKPEKQQRIKQTKQRPELSSESRRLLSFAGVGRTTGPNSTPGHGRDRHELNVPTHEKNQTGDRHQLTTRPGTPWSLNQPMERRGEESVGRLTQRKTSSTWPTVRQQTGGEEQGSTRYHNTHCFDIKIILYTVVTVDDTNTQ